MKTALPPTALLLALVACNGGEPDDTGAHDTSSPEDTGAPGLCFEVDCGDNATCDEATGDCTCEPGYDDVDGACLDTRTVPCADVAPEGATSDVVDVEITFDGTAWSEPAACDWTCDGELVAVDGECVEPEVEVTVLDCRIDHPETFVGLVTDPVAVSGLVDTDVDADVAEDNGLQVRVCRQAAGGGGTACTAATRDTSYTSGTHDARYEGTLRFLAPGEHVFWVSVTTDGTTWVDCDLNGKVSGIPDFGTATVETALSNGGFEDWPSGEAMPTGWIRDSQLGVARADRVRTGANALALTRDGTENSKVELIAESIPVIGGAQYAISYWFLDESPDARGRVVFRWEDATGAPTTEGTLTGPFTADSADWQPLGMTALAPANAKRLSVRTRVYAQDGGAPTGGTVLLDDVSVTRAD